MNSRTPQWLVDEAADLAGSASRFFHKQLVERREEWEAQRGVDRSVWMNAGNLGLLCCSIPAEYGGGGGDLTHDLAVFDAQARAMDTALGIVVHSGVVAHYLLAYGTEEQRRHWLPRLASGECVAAIAMTEPDAGSDLRAVRTTASMHGSSLTINGVKTFISNGATADLILVVCRTPSSSGDSGLSIVLFDAQEDDGLVRGRVLDKIGQHGADTSELFFSDAIVPRSRVLGGEAGRGLDQLKTQLGQERLIIAVGAVAAMETALSLAIDYAKTRPIYGGRLFDLQATRFRLAECAASTEAARALVDASVDDHLSGRLTAERAALVKWWTTDQQCAVVDACLQLFGGHGYMRENAIARMYEDARVQRIYGGSNELLQDIVGRAL